MNTFWRITLIIGSLSLLSGCGIDQQPGSTSTLSLQLPESFPGVSKAATSSDISSLSVRPCFAVSLSGEGIPGTSGDSCNPTQGQFIGWVQGGETVELQVQRGSNRTLDVFYVGAENCGSVNPSTMVGELGSNYIHRLGQKTGINLDQPQVNVTVAISVPSAANTLDRIYSLPDSCRLGADNLLAESRQARSVAGAVSGRFGSGIGISLRLAPSTLKINSSSSSVRIKPHRLGVTE